MKRESTGGVKAGVYLSRLARRPVSDPSSEESLDSSLDDDVDDDSEHEVNIYGRCCIGARRQ